tara:strand:+ start:1362 stop:1613 length:252 start_codon:yes stop_codon:yes gene_type:complete
MIRYFIAVTFDNTKLIEPGDPLVWLGDYAEDTSDPRFDHDNPKLMVRALFDPRGIFFSMLKQDLVEFVPEKELEGDGANWDFS